MMRELPVLQFLSVSIFEKPLQSISFRIRRRIRGKGLFNRWGTADEDAFLGYRSAVLFWETTVKTLELMTFGMMIALGALARGITYSDYEFTKQAELIVQGEVIECHTNGPYKLKVVRVLKGKCPRDTLDLPFRYFYAQSTEQEELSLSKKETGVFFLRYTRNGDCDGIYKMQLIRLGGDTPKNRDRLPYSEGYEIFEGWLGAQKRGTERELKAFGDSIMKTAEALNSHTNSPDARFRESVLSTLKTFEMRTPKAGKTKAKSAGEI